MIVIQLPVEKTYVASEDALKLLDEQLDAAESIKAVGMEQKDCQIENIAKAMEDKKISFDGAFDDLDYKALVKDEIDFAILPSEFLPGNAIFSNPPSGMIRNFPLFSFFKFTPPRAFPYYFASPGILCIVHRTLIRGLTHGIR